MESRPDEVVNQSGPGHPERFWGRLVALCLGPWVAGATPTPSTEEGIHELVDVVGVDTEDPGSAAVGGKLTRGDPAPERLHAHPCSLGCLGERFVGPSCHGGSPFLPT